MPQKTTVKCIAYDGQDSIYTVRAFMPMCIRNQMLNIQADIEAEKLPATALQEYLVTSMTLDPRKITKELYNGEDTSADEMDQLFVEIMRIAGLYIDPTLLAGKSPEERTAIAQKYRQDRMEELKKKQTKL